MKKNYPISSYNKYLCLKPDSTMLLIMLFLLKPYVILVFSFANRSDRMGLINLFYTDKLLMTFGALAGVPVAFLIYALSRRDPGASDFVRRLWKNGTKLIIVSAVLNALLALSPLLMGNVSELTVIGWSQLVISISILPVIYNSSYIHDCFSDFPENKS